MTWRGWILVGLAWLPLALRAEESAAGRITFENFEPGKLGTAIFTESNRVRAAHKLPRLRPQNELRAAADQQAGAMALQLRSTHVGPYARQGNAWARVQHAGLEPDVVAENVSGITLPKLDSEEMWAADYEKLAAYIVRAWLDSPSHRANLLNRQMTHLGCAARLARVPLGAVRVFSAQVFSRQPGRLATAR